MVTATIFETKTKLSELVKKVQKGEEVIITSGREKTPVAKICFKRLGFLFFGCRLARDLVSS